MNSFKALMQKAEENKYDYERKQLKKINRQLEQDEKRKREENERIKKKEEAFNQFKKIAKSLPNDFHKGNKNRKGDRSDGSNSFKVSKDESYINKKLTEKNATHNLKIKKAGNINGTHNNNGDNISKKVEQKKKITNFSTSQSKKHLSFKDLMEKAKHNDISKPVVNNSKDDFREAKKALKNMSGRKKYKDDNDNDDDENNKYQKKKFKKELHNSRPEIKKSKKELLNEQVERKKREKERNLKAYDGSKDRVAQERMKLLKSRGIYHPVTTKISQEVTEMVKRLENRKNTIINNNNNNNNNNYSNNTNQNKSISKSSLHKSSSSSNLHSSKPKNNSNYINSSRKHSREDVYESDEHDSEYDYENYRKLSNDNKGKVKKVKGRYEDYEVYDEDYVNINVSSIIGDIFGYNRHRYRDEEDIDDMEVGYSDVHREEARSLRIAKKEDLKEEELERQRLERLKRRRRE